MRVITGTARGRRLQTLPGNDTRPTAERVKEGLFSAVQFEIEGRRVLDLFAGSGALGIEALSRGAAQCVFVDQSRAAADVVRANLAATGLSDRAQVVCTQAQSFLPGAGVFDAVLLDPPYASGLAAALLPQVAEHLAPGGWIACETDQEAELPERAGAVRLDRTYRYGKIVIRLYRHDTSGEGTI